MAVYTPRWGKEVKKALIDNDLSIADLAVTLDYSRIYLSNVIHGRDYSSEIVTKVSIQLNIPEMGMCDVLR